MYSLVEAFYYSIFSVLTSIKYPYFWLIIFIVFIQYYKIGKMEKTTLGINKRSPLLNTFEAILYGLFAGILGSSIFIYLRVIIDSKDFLFILPLALFLSMLHPRFVCFSYSGGIVSLISLLLGWPQVNVTGIMFVVGVLHLVESVLVLLDGSRTRVPVLMERKGEVIGGFSINSFWPVPFIVFVNRGIPYPILLYAILGYGDFTLSNFPKKKVRESASLLFTFSIILIVLSVLSIYYNLFKYIAVIFAPLAHEIIICLSKYKEKGKSGILTNPIAGLKILDVLPNTVGEKMGLDTGDIILSINGKRIVNKKDLDHIIYYRPKIISAKIFSLKKGIVIKEFISKDEAVDNLGIIVIPSETEDAFMVEDSMPGIIGVLNKFYKRKLNFK